VPSSTHDFSLLNLVAHEMRGPLTLIEGYLSMLRDGDLEGEQRAEAVRVMDAKAKELDNLADILVTAARLETSEVLHQPIVFDVHEAVTVATQRIEPRARLDQATVDVFGVGSPVWVYADRCQVTRVLTNLLGNAITYSSSPAQVAVEIRLGQPAEVAVHDRGVGIAPELHQRIFERFSRFAEGGVNRSSGLGLGLSISRDLAELNGGELLLEGSAPGEGSVFVFRLPSVES
jgi:signal transduction histidine kinase